MLAAISMRIPVSGTGLLGQPDTLLLTQGVLYAGFLLIITGYGFPGSTTIAPALPSI